MSYVNSADPDQAPRQAASDQDRHYLPNRCHIYETLLINWFTVFTLVPD